MLGTSSLHLIYPEELKGYGNNGSSIMYVTEANRIKHFAVFHYNLGIKRLLSFKVDRIIPLMRYTSSL